MVGLGLTLGLEEVEVEVDMRGTVRQGEESWLAGGRVGDNCICYRRRIEVKGVEERERGERVFMIVQCPRCDVM